MGVKLLFACFFCSCLIIAINGAPRLHASCHLTWTWPSTNCTVVNSKIIQQMKTWGPTSACDGEKCLYKISSQSDTEIKGTHETPVKHYVDDLTMSFTSDSTRTPCTVKGYSTSETWYAVLDDGTNYCNLHNLVTGSGLDKDAGFKEDTSDSECTQYSSADCTKY